MKELFKAIDLDISEAHCASWRQPVQKCPNIIQIDWRHDLRHEILAVFLQCMFEFGFCFGLNQLDGLLPTSHERLHRYVQVFIHAFGTSHSFEITDDCVRLRVCHRVAYDELSSRFGRSWIWMMMALWMPTNSSAAA